MPLLGVNKLTKYYGADQIFSDVTFQVNRGEKVALLGVNGAGKSTLLKIVAGIEQATSGEVHFDRGLRVSYQAQEKHFDSEQTLWQEMENAVAHVIELQDQIRLLEQQLQDHKSADYEERLERYGELTARFEHAGGYDIERNILITLNGLGFVEEQFHQPLVQFSGGQKTRAAMAAALLSDPDLLLLDEPTNHLDLEAMEWLEGFLKTWPGTLLVVSHDRRFLDKVTKRTLEMGFGTVEDYPGGYNQFLRLKAERLERRMKEYNAQQEFIAKTEEFIRRYGAGQRSKEAKGREKRLNRLKEQNLIERPRDPGKLKIFLDSQLRSGEMVLTLQKIGVGYENEDGSPKVLVRANDRELFRGERIALIGPNGCGKTTLLRTIVGELLPIEGFCNLGHNVDVGYYAQGHDSLDYEATVLEEILSVDPDLGEAGARTFLGRFLFSGDDVFKKVGDLSGGERSRVALAQLMLLRSNLLIMDEPTNHLDTDAREALEEVLRDFKGSLLFVSHDRYLIDALADKLWIVRDGVVEEHLGNYSDYLAKLEREQRLNKVEQASSVQSEKKANRPAKDNRRSSFDEKQQAKRLARLETEVLKLEQELAKVKAELEAASAIQDIAKVTQLGNKYVDLEKAYNARYDEWAEMVSESS